MKKASTTSPRERNRGEPTPESTAGRGVRLIAAVEALKGVLVLVAGFGLLSLVHHDLQAFADRLIRHSHLNPAHHYPRIFLEWISHATDSRLRALAGLAFLYSAVRLVEAYGLWLLKPWAEWFAIIAGGIYLPVEIYELLKRATWIRAAVFVTNLLIVLYLAWVRFRSHERRLAAS